MNLPPPRRLKHCVAALCLCLLSGLAHASERMALVIGNANYAQTPLNNAINDARDIAQVFKQMGFHVLLRENLDRRALLKALREFGTQLHHDSVGVFYYSGHAIQYQGRNYLLPIQTPILDAEQLDAHAVQANRILEEISMADNPTNILIFDACRNNTFLRKPGNSAQGLAKMQAPPGTLIAYATAPGEVAQDTSGGRNSPYTHHLLHWLTQPNLSVGQMFNRVRDAVIRDTDHQQVPSEESFLRKDFYFGGIVDEKTLAQQETQRLLNELRTVEQQKRQKNQQQKLQQRLQQCQVYEQNFALIQALSGAENEAALPCYQAVLRDDPNNADAQARLNSLERRYRAWAEGALRQGQWQRAQSYVDDLKKINPNAADLSALQERLHSSQEQAQQHQQLKHLGDELLDVSADHDIPLTLPSHVPKYWVSDRLDISLNLNQNFTYYLPLPAQPSLFLKHPIDIQLSTALPDGLSFAPQYLKLSGRLPQTLSQPLELIFIAHIAEHNAPFTLRIHPQTTQKTLAMAHPPLTDDNAGSLEFFNEVVTRCFTALNYQVILQAMPTEQALHLLPTRHAPTAYYPHPHTTAFYTSEPLSSHRHWQQQQAHLLMSKHQPQPVHLLYRFNHQLQRLKHSGALHFIQARYQPAERS